MLGDLEKLSQQKSKQPNENNHSNSKQNQVFVIVQTINANVVNSH